ncbi:type II secretion system GspH family protein [Clostridium estertheticum]|uniref:Type II secretion system GspH family protein n=1 Tax=Clostridium estertheticum TaxID=238834 RepID=A0AA47I7W5_9CLOT|nr:type II secretion system protein [Clostridium estertheticum]MBU3155216.1 type II secretion system GspH family protein [Clostridium estertheticum]MBU3198659.1 type II secretion system GspH family protein [Clostridium estertheticum]WAG61270.1 type II secretion system GspH family protein [Clostridium estertheticum]WAG64634.1 type II secretion system GspH family protein [Clostridium estertheticum]
MIKKGFTLVEIIIVMALVFLMIGVVDGMFISYVKNYKISVVQNNGFNYLSEAIATIEKEVNYLARDVITEENVIKINNTNGNDIKYIKCINSKLYVLYGTMYKSLNDSSSKALIVDNVKEFVAIKSGKNIYIKIIWCNGQSIERCLVIENAN